MGRLPRCAQAVLILMLLMFGSAALVGAASPMVQKMAAKKGVAPSGSEEVALPERLNEADIDELMSRMTDEQVRRLLLEKLREDALKQAAVPVKQEEMGYLARFIVWVQNSVVRLRDRVKFLLSGVTSAPGDLPKTISDMTAGQGFRPFFIGLFRVALAFFAAWLANWFYRRKTTALRERIEATPREAGWQLKVARVILRLLLDLISVGIFIVVTLIIYFAFFEDNPMRRTFLLTYLTALTLVGVLALLSRLTLSPRSPALRFLPMDDETAGYLHR